MAVQTVSLTIVILVLAFSVQAQKPCNETQCKLLPVGKEVASRFQTLVAERGVKMIYLDLKIGNDGHHPLESNERFFGKRWVWAKTISEPMLLLSEEDNEFEIYSLGLLKHQVRHFTVYLEEQPPGCLAHFNPHCQDYVVGKTLLVEFVKGSSGNTAPAEPSDCMCTLHIVNSASLKYACCSVQNYTALNDPIVRCGPLAESSWFQTLSNSIYVFTAIFMMYCSAIPLLFPDFLFNLEKECEKETKEEPQIRYHRTKTAEYKLVENPNSKVNKGLQGNDEDQITSYDENEQREGIEEGDNKAAVDGKKEEEKEAIDCEIPLDDASPISFGALLSDYVKTLPDFQINFNLKMLFLFFVIFPFFLYLRFALMMSYRLESYNEFSQKFSNCQSNTILEFFVCWSVGFGWTRWKASFLVIMHYMTLPCCFIVFVILLCIRPKDFFYHPQPKNCCIKCQSISLGDEMISHLQLLHHWAYDLTFFVLKHYMDALEQCLVCLDREGIRRLPRVFRSFCYLLFTLLGMVIIVVLGPICIIISLTVGMAILVLSLSPLCTFFAFIVKKTGELLQSCDKCNKYVRWFFQALVSCLTCTPVVVFMFSVTLATISFIIQICFFTVTGLVLNAGLLTPYAAFTLVVTSNMYLCYSNLQGRYKEIKQMISKHWKENKKELPCMGHINDDTIPKELFWFVCGKGTQQDQPNVLPLRTEICFMLRDVALIFTFLFVSLLATLTFTSMNDISSLISTIIVFVSGVIPSLILKGFTKSVNLSGWKKINTETKVKRAVQRYIIHKRDKKRNAESGQNSGQPSWFFQYKKRRDFDSQSVLEGQ